MSKVSSINQYDNIYNSNIHLIKDGFINIDNYLNGTRIDSRKGISLIIPITTINDFYSNLTKELMDIDSYQYIYPFDDLHITIFDFIQGTQKYKVSTDDEKKFIEITTNVLNTIKAFSIEFKGITFSTAAGMIQGFDNNKLVDIRANFKNRLFSKLASHLLPFL